MTTTKTSFTNPRILQENIFIDCSRRDLIWSIIRVPMVVILSTPHWVMFSPILAGVIITTNMVNSTTITSDNEDIMVFCPSHIWVIVATNKLDCSTEILREKEHSSNFEGITFAEKKI